MPELICLDMPCGQAMIDRVKRAWDEGDAVFPLDQRVPQNLRQQLIDIAQPTRIATVNEEVHYPGEPTEPHDALVIATSGTTGRPKCIVHTQQSLTASAQATHEYLKVTTNDAWLCCLPPSHVGGFGVLARSILTGTKVHAVERFSIDSYNDAAHNGATLVSLVATALQRINPTMYRKILLGGSAAPTDLPNNCVTTYGLTETGGGIVYNSIALPGVEIEIREGRVCLRAPMLMRSYRDNTSPLDNQGWLTTGDLGQLSLDGRLTVFGRHDDLIITGGENVWPETVERSLMAHPNIDDVCVAGLPDQQWGEAVTAFVVSPRPELLSLDELREWVKSSLPSFCAPKKIFFVAEIPRTSLGKMQRKSLVRQALDADA